MAIYDISLPISTSLAVWPGDPPIEVSQPSHLERGDPSTLTRIAMGAHSGTHVDAPAHFVRGGLEVDRLDLSMLVGPSLVVAALEAEALSADRLAELPIPPGTTRLLLQTRNSDRWGAGAGEFYRDYVAIPADGAQWLVAQGIRLLGIDYLSIAPFDNPAATHQILLGAGIIVVEGLDLRGIRPGAYQLICLPLKLAGSEGAPARAILIDPDR